MFCGPGAHTRSPAKSEMASEIKLGRRPEPAPLVPQWATVYGGASLPSRPSRPCRPPCICRVTQGSRSRDKRDQGENHPRRAASPCPHINPHLKPGRHGYPEARGLEKACRIDEDVPRVGFDSSPNSTNALAYCPGLG